MTNGFIAPHGSYRKLFSYQKAEIVYDATACFCKRFLRRGDRTIDQMVQAARSGKQNIAEGSQISGTSREMEIKLTNVARASLEELLTDYHDYLRTNGLSLWDKDDSRALYIRKLSAGSDESPATYDVFRAYIETKNAETVANIIICLIYQTTYLLDKLIKRQEQRFIENGGIREQMTTARKAFKKSNNT